jgi:hypothetical protein
MDACYFFFGSSGGNSMSFAVTAFGAPISGMSMRAVQRRTKVTHLIDLEDAAQARRVA